MLNENEIAFCKDKHIPLVFDNGCIEYVIYVKDKQKYNIEFEVFRVVSWTCEGEPFFLKKSVEGNMSWDGCGHLYLGEENGYCYLCYKSGWESYCMMMAALWDYMSDNIEGWDNDAAR